jgi:glutamate 5-kinase
MTKTRKPLLKYRRVVIKIGSALLVDRATGLKKAWLDAMCADIAGLKAKGVEVLVVSSGAIALGRTVLNLPAGALKLEESQAAAAVGQIALARAWSESLSTDAIVAGQVLLTLGDTEERRRYLNARATINQLLKLGAVPIINENDTVATAEIRYGDNDRLSARVATMIEADCLVLLSDVDGLYTAPPGKVANAEHVPVVPAITRQVEEMAGGAASHLSRGGMTTKIEAAKIATKAGTAMIIAKGTDAHPLRALWTGGRHTLFEPVETRAQARKRWIMGSLDVIGWVTIDAGAVRALEAGKSLLPVGITKVKGEFARGDAVSILDPDGNEVARGLAGLDSEDAQLVKGKNSSRVAEMLGINARSEFVHRDNLVLIRGQRQ